MRDVADECRCLQMYAPRDKDEVEMVLEIVRAASWFVCVGDKSKVGHELGSDPAEVVPAWEGS